MQTHLGDIGAILVNQRFPLHRICQQSIHVIQKIQQCESGAPICHHTGEVDLLWILPGRMQPGKKQSVLIIITFVSQQIVLHYSVHSFSTLYVPQTGALCRPADHNQHALQTSPTSFNLATALSTFHSGRQVHQISRDCAPFQ